MAISTNTAKFVKSGATLDYTASADVACGDFVQVCGCVCLATWDIAAGTTGAVKILHKGEVISVTADDAIGETDAGVAIYITSAGVVTKTADGNTLLGYTAAAVGASDTTFEVVCA